MRIVLATSSALGGVLALVSAASAQTEPMTTGQMSGDPQIGGLVTFLLPVSAIVAAVVMVGLDKLVRSGRRREF